MPVEWKKTKHQGVRYYEHKTRKHGVNLDRYFAIRYQVDGKRREEGLGSKTAKPFIELVELIGIEPTTS